MKKKISSKKNQVSKKLIFVSSKLRGDIENNMKLAECLCRIVALRGFVPVAPHIIFTRFLDDNSPNERELGLSCGLELLRLCNEMWVFNFAEGDDSGISEGMQREIDLAKKLGIPIKYLGPLEENTE
jgi:hypothetical protein